MPATQQAAFTQSTRRYGWGLAALLVLVALWVAAPRRATDPDTLSRLAMGRLLWQRHVLPASDPFTFADPSVRFGDPEWLGDLLLSAVHGAWGEAGLVALALVLGTLGYLAALRLASALGGHPFVTACLLLWTIPVVSPRVVARNDLHVFWLVPSLLGLLTRRPRGWWWALLGLGWVWANLHSSFVLALPLMAAAWLERREPLRRSLAVMAVWCLLPLLGPSGIVSYEQLYDHLFHGAIYRRLITEWQTPLTSAGVLAVLPLHVLTLLGALVWWRGTRGWLRSGMFVLGVVLAYSARRFLPAMVYLIVPAIAQDVSALFTNARFRRLPLGVLALSSALYLSLGLRSALRREPTSIFASALGPGAAASFLAAHAAASARIANTFDDGPWLDWITAPRLQHYLDPRNNLGARRLEDYMTRVLPDPEAFVAEAARLDIGIVLVRFDDPYGLPLRYWLATQSAWRLVYWDGHHAVYAKADDSNRALIQRFGYEHVRATFDLSYLHAPVPDAELQRLRATGPELADLLQGYQLQRAGRVREARVWIERASARLTYSREFFRFWSAAPQP